MTTEDKIREVMGLVEKHRQEVIKVMDGEGSLVDVQRAEEAIETKLRELVERRPIDFYDISMAHLNIGSVGQLNATERIVRWTEAAHGITQEKQG